MARAARRQTREKAPGMRIRRDDTVAIIAGKDKGKTGKVLRTDPKRQKVFVESLNMVKRHQRPTSVKDTSKGGQVGGIVDKEGPIHVSNVMVLDPKSGDPTRVAIKREDGRRIRVAKKSGTEIDN